MHACERYASLAQLDLRLLVERIHFPSRMVEERVPNEIILVTVVAADEQKRQGPNRAGRVGLVKPAALFVDEGAGLIVPPPQVTAEPAGCLFGEIDQNSLNADFDGSSVCRQISAAVEVVLIYNWSTKKPLRS